MIHRVLDAHVKCIKTGNLEIINVYSWVLEYFVYVLNFPRQSGAVGISLIIPSPHELSRFTITLKNCNRLTSNKYVIIISSIPLHVRRRVYGLFGFSSILFHQEIWNNDILLFLTRSLNYGDMLSSVINRQSFMPAVNCMPLFGISTIRFQQKIIHVFFNIHMYSNIIFSYSV